MPLASEGEVEHEKENLDVELWRNKLVAWETTEVVRKARMRRNKFVKLSFSKHLDQLR